MPQGGFIPPEDVKSERGPHMSPLMWADGGLIGGASLKPDQFVEIINSANQED